MIISYASLTNTNTALKDCKSMRNAKRITILMGNNLEDMMMMMIMFRYMKTNRVLLEDQLPCLKND